MYPKCPQCAKVPSHFLYKVLPSSFASCPACGAKLKPAFWNGLLLDALPLGAFTWTLFVEHTPYTTAFLCLAICYLVTGPLRRLRVR